MPPTGGRCKEHAWIVILTCAHYTSLYLKCQPQNPKVLTKAPSGERKKKKGAHMELKKLPELLAPAGSPDALYAAIDVSEKKR